MSRFHLTMSSSNRKTGPMPVATSSKDTCPIHCPLKARICYARYGKIHFWWEAISRGLHGYDLRTFIGKIGKIPEGAIWRYGQAGDLPGDGRKINAKALRSIANAQKGRRGYCYTHYLGLPRGWTWGRWAVTKTFKHNLEAIRQANQNGFTVNVSADTVEDADQLAELGVGPLAVLSPASADRDFTTAYGHDLVLCCHYSVGIQCRDCGLCAQADRLAIVGLPVHGSGARHLSSRPAGCHLITAV